MTTSSEDRPPLPPFYGFFARGADQEVRAAEDGWTKKAAIPEKVGLAYTGGQHGATTEHEVLPGGRAAIGRLPQPQMSAARARLPGMLIKELRSFEATGSRWRFAYDFHRRFRPWFRSLRPNENWEYRRSAG